MKRRILSAKWIEMYHFPLQLMETLTLLKRFQKYKMLEVFEMLTILES